MEKHAMLAVFLPSVLPPPIPLSPFLLAAGALGISRNRFLLVFGAARTLRYGAITWLGVVYGRRMVRLWSATLQKWSAPLLWVFVSMVLIGVALGIWKWRSQRKSVAEPDGSLEPASVHGD
jgi:membrane protein DedA with SNARE-associated domain